MTRDPESGAMLIDGVVADRTFQLAGSVRNGPPRRTGRPSRAVLELRRRERATQSTPPTEVDEFDELD